MRREIRELDLLDLSRPPAGSVASWVQLVVGCAALTAVGVAATSARALWDMDGVATRLDGFWFRNGLAIATAIAIAAAFVPGARTSRTVRLAALLPIILLAGMLAAWAGWELIASRMMHLRQIDPLILDVPIGPVLVAMLSATCIAALAVSRLSGRHRRDTWMRAIVVIALVDLLLLGLWLP